IAKNCALSEATLFFYFRSKNEIFTSLLFEGIEFWARGLEKIAALDLPPGEKLARIWKFYGQVDAEHPEYYQLSAFLARPMATADVSEEVRERIIRRSGDNFRQLAAILEDVLGNGRGRIAADLLWSTYLGLTVLKESRINLGAPVHPTKKDLARVFEILSKGLLPD
ncbi:MAG: TetR/AcrR family transcriptional regulator, partial [Proteobacteria bacterium]|nr:TetR/AcrR family transcriptional regulator [Pseudomonadota bacterium]